MKLAPSRLIDAGCTHWSSVNEVEPRSAGCEGCLAEGRDDWVSLRVCLACGHVGCCDASPRRHARAHFREEGHPIAHEKDGDGAWCYVDCTAV